MKNKPLVTVYITNHNYGKFVKNAIDSVLSQTFKNFELIIIDDGSTDKSKQIIKKYKNDKRITTIFQKNKGLTWDKGKGFDTFGPIGPYIVTKDEIPDFQKLNMYLCQLQIFY